MYLLNSTARQHDMCIPAPFGPGLSAVEAQKYAYMEIWCSNYDEPGDDFTEFRFFASNNNSEVVKVVRHHGY